MQYAYTYILIPLITILGHSNHKTGITIEFTLKFDAICMYICPDSILYYSNPKTGIMIEFPLKFHIQLQMNSPESIHSPILRSVSSQESIQSPILRSV